MKTIAEALNDIAAWIDTNESGPFHRLMHEALLAMASEISPQLKAELNAATGEAEPAPAAQEGPST